MPLSEHEKTQFELLTADLTGDDSSLKKMTKREKATAMRYFSLPWMSARVGQIVYNVMLLLGLASISVAFYFLAAGNFAAVGMISIGMILFFGAAALLRVRL
jgi:hypothetical protein